MTPPLKQRIIVALNELIDELEERHDYFTGPSALEDLLASQNRVNELRKLIQEVEQSL